MVDTINYTHLWLLICLWRLAGISTFPLERGSVSSESLQINQTYSHKRANTTQHNNGTRNDDSCKNCSDLLVAATDFQHLPVSIKPRGFHLPKNRPVRQKENETPRSAAQTYYSHYYPDLPPLSPARPYYSLAEEPVIAKFVSQKPKQFESRQQDFAFNEASILGSGDFGILKGGTFYSGEEQSYTNQDGSDFYYGDTSNTHTVSSTEGFVQKYTYPEEQFAEFRDFADLGVPVDSDFSQFVVVYAAKNSTSHNQNSKPKNIFEQLQEIDKEKALEQKKLRKNQTSSSVTKLKLVKTKQIEKKWVQKQPTKLVEEDPLIALS